MTEAREALWSTGSLRQTTYASIKQLIRRCHREGVQHYITVLQSFGEPKLVDLSAQPSRCREARRIIHRCRAQRGQKDRVPMEEHASLSTTVRYDLLSPCGPGRPFSFSPNAASYSPGVSRSSRDERFLFLFYSSQRFCLRLRHRFSYSLNFSLSPAPPTFRPPVRYARIHLGVEPVCRAVRLPFHPRLSVFSLEHAVRACAPARQTRWISSLFIASHPPPVSSPSARHHRRAEYRIRPCSSTM